MRRIHTVAFLLLSAAFAPTRQAHAQLLDFERAWQPFTNVSTMYGDGTKRATFDSEGNMLSISLVKLTSGIGVYDALLACEGGSTLSQGCSSTLGANPSGTQAIVPETDRVRLDVVDGFSDRFSLWYKPNGATATVNIFSEFGASGELLGSMLLEGAGGCTTTCDWSEAALSFLGVAKSVQILVSAPSYRVPLPEGAVMKRSVFDENGEVIATYGYYPDGTVIRDNLVYYTMMFDDLRLGGVAGDPVTAVPEPSPAALLTAGLGVFAVWAKRRRVAAQRTL